MRYQAILAVLFPISVITAQPPIDRLIPLASVATTDEFDAKARELGFKFEQTIRLRTEEEDTAYVEHIYTDTIHDGAAGKAEKLGLLLMDGNPPAVYLLTATDVQAAAQAFAAAHAYRPSVQSRTLMDPRTTVCDPWSDGTTVLLACRSMLASPLPYALWIHAAPE